MYFKLHIWLQIDIIPVVFIILDILAPLLVIIELMMAESSNSYVLNWSWDSLILFISHNWILWMQISHILTCTLVVVQFWSNGFHWLAVQFNIDSKIGLDICTCRWLGYLLVLMRAFSLFWYWPKHIVVLPTSCNYKCYASKQTGYGIIVTAWQKHMTMHYIRVCTYAKPT